MDDAEEKAGQHQPYCGLRIDAGPAIVSAVEFGDFSVQPAQIEDTGDAREDVLIGNQVAQRAGKKLELLSAARYQHPHPPFANSNIESRRGGFFNSPRVHFMRNALSYVPKGQHSMVA